MKRVARIRASFSPFLNGAQPLRGTGHGVPHVFACARSYNGTLAGQNDLPALQRKPASLVATPQLGQLSEAPHGGFCQRVEEACYRPDLWSCQKIAFYWTVRGNDFFGSYTTGSSGCQLIPMRKSW